MQKNKIHIIFLDVDGVLNSRAFLARIHIMEPLVLLIMWMDIYSTKS